MLYFASRKYSSHFSNPHKSQNFHKSLAISIHSSVLLKGIVHPKMKILSPFTHPQVVPNLNVFICSAVHKGRYLEECFNQTDLNPHWLP